MPVVYAGEPPGRFEGGGVGCQSENSPPRQYGRQQAGAQAGMGHRCGAPGLRNLFQQEVDACDEAPSREEECEASGEEVAPDEFGAFGRIGIRGDAHERRRDEGTEEDEQKAFGHRNGIGERGGCRFVPAAGFAAEYAERQRRRIGIGDVESEYLPMRRFDAEQVARQLGPYEGQQHEAIEDRFPQDGNGDSGDDPVCRMSVWCRIHGFLCR